MEDRQRKRSRTYRTSAYINLWRPVTALALMRDMIIKATGIITVMKSVDQGQKVIERGTETTQSIHQNLRRPTPQEVVQMHPI
jgi:hypothetical protein